MKFTSNLNLTPSHSPTKRRIQHLPYGVVEPSAITVGVTTFSGLGIAEAAAKVATANNLDLLQKTGEADSKNLKLYSTGYPSVSMVDA